MCSRSRRQRSTPGASGRSRKKEENKAVVEEHAAGEDTPDAPLPTDPMPAKLVSLADATIPHMRDKMLSRLGANLSVSNLRGLKGESGCKLSLLRMLEFATGGSADFALVGRLRCFSRLGLFLRRRAENRHMRSMLLSLPADWGESGLAFVQGLGPVEGSIVLQHRYTQEEAVIPKEQVLHHTSLDQLSIEFSWSEERFALASSADGAAGQFWKLVNFFKPPETISVDTAASPAKLTKLMAPSPQVQVKRVSAMKGENHQGNDGKASDPQSSASAVGPEGVKREASAPQGSRATAPGADLASERNEALDGCGLGQRATVSRRR